MAHHDDTSSKAQVKTLSGRYKLLDLPPEVHGGSAARSYATFSVNGGWLPVHARTLAESFIRQFIPTNASSLPERTAEVVAISRGQATVRLRWFSRFHHVVTITRLGRGKWLASAEPHPEHPGALRGLSRFVETWLSSDHRVYDVQWFTTDEWTSTTQHRHPS